MVAKRSLMSKKLQSFLMTASSPSSFLAVPSSLKTIQAHGHLLPLSSLSLDLGLGVAARRRRLKMIPWASEYMATSI